MTIEITKPETEALIERHLRSGRFHDIDELLNKALGSLDEQAPAPVQRSTGQALTRARRCAACSRTKKWTRSSAAHPPSAARSISNERRLPAGYQRSVGVGAAPA